MPNTAPQRPIGYWLRLVDGLLTRRIDEAQRAHGLQRLDWQLLNVLREAGPLPRDELGRHLEAFAAGDGLDRAVGALTQLGWLEAADGALRLTPGGERGHTLVLATQTRVRQQAVQGVSEEEYQVALRVLKRLARNLEAGEADA